MRNVPVRYDEPTRLSPFTGGLASPVGGISRLQRAIDRIFDDFMTPALWPSAAWPSAWQGAELLPRCEIDETDDQYMINMDVPGMSTEDIAVELRGNQLTLSGERRRRQGRPEQAREERGELSESERSYSRFSQSFTLPDDANPDEISASCENGVLAVRVGKSQPAKPRRIEIGTKRSQERLAASPASTSAPQAAGKPSASGKQASA